MNRKIYNSSCSSAQQKLVTELFQTSPLGWEEIYERKDVYAVIYQRRRSVALSYLDKTALPPKSLVLEIGCGPGVTTAALAQKGYTVYATDIVIDMVRLARQKAREQGVSHNVLTSVGDAQHLAFGDGRFDLVIIVGVTEWMESLTRFLEEIARVLKPGAYLIIASDNASSVHLLIDPQTNPLFTIPRESRTFNYRHLSVSQTAPQNLRLFYRPV